jgi:hypothetical protein
MGYLAPPIEPGTPIEVEIRHDWVPAQQVDPPFIKT